VVVVVVVDVAVERSPRYTVPAGFPFPDHTNVTELEYTPVIAVPTGASASV
jgi:hypothetical protein